MTSVLTDNGILLDDLSIRIPLPGRPRRWVHAAERVSLALEPGTVTAVVGESGCGKSILALAMMGMLPAGSITAGAIRYRGDDLLSFSESRWQASRGSQIGLVPQSAATHLNPVRTVGATMRETLSYHESRVGRQDARDLLRNVGLDPAVTASYPHELSGGMAQRVLVALTLAVQPEVLVADEPTSALDPTTGGVVLRAIAAHAASGRAVLLITHDLVAARTVADVAAVMYAGRLLEIGPAREVLHDPLHDYSRALLDALPERGMNPAPGVPSSLVDIAPGTCSWHERTGTPCAPEPPSPLHFVACRPTGRP